MEDNALKIINWRLPRLWYRDADQDGYGDLNTTLLANQKPASYIGNGLDCDDANSELNPGLIWYKDADGDGFGYLPYTAACEPPIGYTSGPLDCDDSRSDLNNPIWYRDYDGDGYGSEPYTFACEPPEGYVSNVEDCNDADANVKPGNGCPPGPGVVAVESPAEVFGVFPNPNNGIFSVRHNNQNIQFNVMSSFGQPVKVSITRNEEFYLIDISDKSSGVYLVGMSVGEKQIVARVAKF